jgi:magnesium transporter
MLVLTDLERDKIEASLRDDHFFWLDLEDPSADEIKEAAELMHLHPVAVEDTIEFGQRPKVDVYENHLLIVYYTARVDEDGTTAPIEVHIYLSGSFMLTVRRIRCSVLDDLHDQLSKAPIHDEGYLVYRIFDTLTDAYYPVINAIEERVDALEADVLLHARREQLPVIYRLRQEVRELLRIAAAQRDHFMPTAEAIRALPGLEQGTREYLRDVGDHLTQVAGELLRQTEDLNALTGTYFNANADRLNVVATRLTIVGTLFIVTTLVTGFFGQNFGWLVRNISTRTDFLIFGVGGLVVPLLLAAAFLWAKRDDLF